MTTALISIYYPTDTVKQNVKAIASQTDLVYLCDNSPVSNYPMFSGPDMPDHVHYVCFHRNLGLSGAFNRVLKDPSLPWSEDDDVLFFDQDSRIGEGHVQKLLSVYRDLQREGFPAGCLGCVFFNSSHGATEIPRIKKLLLPGTYAVSSIITSSMLCTYRDLKQIGFWNDHVFLDMADWDLCWRMQSAGKLCCLTDATVMNHSVGSSEKKIGPLKLRVGQPVREYYQIRECLYLLRQRYTPLKYRVRFFAMLLIRSPLHVIFLDHRKQRIYYICKGFLDFFRGKHGAIDTDFSSEEISV